MSQKYDVTWSDALKQYQNTIGAISVSSTSELVGMIESVGPFSDESHVLDVGCGPGAVTLAILARNPTTPIEAIDTSPKMLEDLATNMAKLEIAKPQVNSAAVDLHDIAATYGPAKFSHVFASHVLHVAAKSYAASSADMYHILKPGGHFALATFTPRSDLYLITDRVYRVYDSDYKPPSFAPDPNAWSTYGQVYTGLKTTGFVNIKTVIRRTSFPTMGPDDWVEFFFNGKNPAVDAQVRPFFDTHDVSLEDVKETLRAVVRDEWDGGKGISMEYVLAVGQKPR